MQSQLFLECRRWKFVCIKISLLHKQLENPSCKMYIFLKFMWTQNSYICGLFSPFLQLCSKLCCVFESTPCTSTAIQSSNWKWLEVCSGQTFASCIFICSSSHTWSLCWLLAVRFLAFYGKNDLVCGSSVGWNLTFSQHRCHDQAQM